MALACARGAHECEGRVEKVRVTVDINTMKNTFADQIPGLNGGGLIMAATIGVLKGKYQKTSMTFEGVNKKDLSLAEKFISEGRVEIEVDGARRALFIQADVQSKDHKVRVRIEELHNNISLVEVDGEPLPPEDDILESVKSFSNTSFLEFLSFFNIEELVDIVERIELSELAFLDEGIDMIERLAEEGLEKRPGIGYGAALRDMISRQDISHNVLSYARIKSGAAGDARMGGLPLPVMGSFGSGNYGIVIYSSLSIIARKEKPPADKVTRAIALAHLVVGITKYYTGTLTPHCGCAIAAGAAATVGAVYLLGGTVQEMDNAFRSFISTLGGIICGGVNEHCAQKISTAAVSVIENAYLAVRSKLTPKEMGIIGRDYKETLVNLKALTREGMKNVDPVLLDILNRKYSEDHTVSVINGEHISDCP